MSLQETDQAAEAVAVAPRVSLQSMATKVSSVRYLIAGEATGETLPKDHPLSLLTLCLLVVENGFTVVGKSAPASPENFNAELGRKFAYEDAIRQLWPLEGYALREKLSQ